MPTADTLGGGVVELVLNAGPVAKFVLAVLLLFSIASWGVILFKSQQVRTARRQTVLPAREAGRPAVAYFFSMTPGFTFTSAAFFSAAT